MRHATARLLRLVSLALTALALLGPVLAAEADSHSGQRGLAPQPNPILPKTMLPARPRVGQAARITISAINAGSANAENVVITDPIPDNLALTAVVATQGSILVNHRIVTVYVGTLAAGQTVVVTNDVVVMNEFAEDTPFTNCTGLTYRDGTARLACFPFGPSYKPVSIATPPVFLPEAGADDRPTAWILLSVGLACLALADRLRHPSYS